MDERRLNDAIFKQNWKKLEWWSIFFDPAEAAVGSDAFSVAIMGLMRP